MTDWTDCLGRKQRKCYSREHFDSEFRQLIEKETFRKDKDILKGRLLTWKPSQLLSFKFKYLNLSLIPYKSHTGIKMQTPLWIFLDYLSSL